MSGLDICTLFDSEDAVRLGYDPTGVPEAPLSGTDTPRCGWRPEGQRAGGVTIWADVERSGLSEMYSLPRESYPDFREFEVSRYPAVQASLGGPTDRTCFIHVGISDRQFITFGSTLGHGQEDDPCDQAVTFAEALIPSQPTQPRIILGSQTIQQNLARSPTTVFQQLLTLSEDRDVEPEHQNYT